MKVKSLSRVRLFTTPWTAAYQAPPCMGFFQARVLEWGAIAFSVVKSSRGETEHDPLNVLDWWEPPGPMVGDRGSVGW